MHLAPAGSHPVQSYEPLPPEEEGGLNLRRYMGAIWRYKWLILLMVIVGGALAFAATQFLPRQYQASSTVWVEPDGNGSSGPIRPSGLLNSKAWVELLQSFAVLDPVVIEQKLYLHPESSADSDLFASFSVGRELRPGAYHLTVGEDGATFTLASADGTVLQRGRVGQPIGPNLGFEWTPSPALLTAGRDASFSVEAPRNAALQLRSALQVRIDENGNFLTVTLVGGNPAEVASAVNGLTERFVAVSADLKRAKLDATTKILGEQLETSGEGLREAELALEQFRVGTITLPSDRSTPAPAGLMVTQDPVFSSYFQMQVQRDQLQQDRAAIARALQGAQRSGSVVTGLETIPSVQQSSELQAALGELTNKRAELRALQSRYTEEYLPVRRLMDEIETLQQQTIPRLSAGVQSQLATQQATVEGRIASASDELQQIPTRSIEEHRLERRRGSAENLYNNLRQRFEESRLAAASSIPDVQVLDRASVPQQPINDEQRGRIAALAVLASLGLGVVAALILDRVDPRVRYPEQVTHDMGLPILGAVPHVAAPRKRLGSQNTAQVVEAFREIRLNLAHSYGAAGPLITTITSPGMGDGKSFVSSNLALAFADQGHRTLLIDGDIRRGGLHRMFDITRVPGLTDYLAGQAPREQIIHRTAYPALDVIGCGSRMKGGPELLGSPAMSRLLLDLRSQYSVILIDSPPLAAGVDPFALGTLAGSMLLVVRAGNTNRELAGAKLNHVDRLPIRMLGAVLNDVPDQGVYRYYSYISGYEAQDEIAPVAEGPKQLQRV